MDNWDDMRVFLAVARAESLSGAAPVLKMDPATLGRRIARLECALGATLFLKSPQGYALTDLGARMRDKAAEAGCAIVGGHTVLDPELKYGLCVLGNVSPDHSLSQTGAQTGDRLGRVIAAVGLIQNFSALRAVATEGIQHGHMGLHARNVAIAAGATGDQIDHVAQQMIARGTIRQDVAQELLESG